MIFLSTVKISQNFNYKNCLIQYYADAKLKLILEIKKALF